MISRKLWWTYRKQRRAPRPDGFDAGHMQVRVTREGYFLFGFIPLFVFDVRIEEL